MGRTCLEHSVQLWNTCGDRGVILHVKRLPDRIVLPSIYGPVCVVLAVLQPYALRAGDQALKRVWGDVVPCVYPYELPSFLLAALSGPAMLFNTYGSTERKVLISAGTGFVWWWWVGTCFDRGLIRPNRSRFRHWTELLTIIALLAAVTAALLTCVVGDAIFRDAWDLCQWHEAMLTLDTLFLWGVAVCSGIAARRNHDACADKQRR